MKLVSLNIEGDNHYDKIFPLFEREKPDIICLQEFFLCDLSLFEERLSMQGYAVATSIIDQPNPYRMSPRGEQGVAIFTRLPAVFGSKTYVGQEGVFPNLVDVGADGVNHAIAWLDIQEGGEVYRIVTTHFTWSPGGSVTDLQRDHLRKLLTTIEPLGEIILCGDFNAPRGKEIFDTLASTYQDNIPGDVQTTMDNALHRNSNLDPLVVDVLFSSPSYAVADVRVVSGVSDHCAIVASVSRYS